MQHVHNANPDNHFDRRHYCWTADPACGLDVGPKRPWHDLKDETKNIAKFSRDPEVNERQAISGFRGF